MKIDQLHKKFLECTKVTTDTRNISQNSLFIALKGERFDANEFAKEALEKGSKYAIIDNPKSSSCIQRARKGEVFLIEFLEKDPSVGQILCDYTIPDSIIVKPKVWDSIPSYLQRIE